MGSSHLKGTGFLKVFTFEVNGTNLTIEFSYTGPLTTVQEIIEDAARYLFSHGKGDHGTEEEPIIFEDLSNNERLALVDKYVKRVILDMANSHKSNAAQKVAREAAAAEEYEL